MTLPDAPEQNPAVLAARFARALVAEAGAVSRADVDARRLPLGPISSLAASRSRFERPAPPREWRLDANCRGVDPDLFFPERGGSKELQARQLDQAKAVCDGCSVRAQCLVDALERQERFGVWGGLSERERRVLRRKLPRWARCSRCGRRYQKTSPGQKFCGTECPLLAVPRSRMRAS